MNTTDSTVSAKAIRDVAEDLERRGIKITGSESWLEGYRCAIFLMRLHADELDKS